MPLTRLAKFLERLVCFKKAARPFAGWSSGQHRSPREKEIIGVGETLRGIMYFPEGGETHHGLGSDAPFVALAGNNCQLNLAGRYVHHEVDRGVRPYISNRALWRGGWSADRPFFHESNIRAWAICSAKDGGGRSSIKRVES